MAKQGQAYKTLCNLLSREDFKQLFGKKIKIEGAKIRKLRREIEREQPVELNGSGDMLVVETECTREYLKRSVMYGGVCIGYISINTPEYESKKDGSRKHTSVKSERDIARILEEEDDTQSSEDAEKYENMYHVYINGSMGHYKGLKEATKDLSEAVLDLVRQKTKVPSH